MRRSLHTALFSLVLFFAVTALMALPVSAQKPQTILDYYLSLPERYLKFAGSDAATRQSAIYIKDIEHNYLQARQPNGELYTALALFKSEDGNDLIAVENRSCVRGCTEEFFFLRYQDDQWMDVTSQMMPAIDDSELRAKLGKQFKADFQPRVLHQLSAGGKSIDVFEYWSGIALGQLVWANTGFTFKPLAAQSPGDNQNALASVNNAAGDRLQIMSVAPVLPARLPLNGHLMFRINYDLKSAARARIFIQPVINDPSLRDNFNGGSVSYERGSGATTAYVGFYNQARLHQVLVTMVPENGKELLTLTYDVDAAWEGVMECPAFHAFCFPNRFNSGAPFGCMLVISGLRPEAQLTYQWSVAGGVIINGQGTRRINLDLAGASPQDITITAEIIGLPSSCATKATANLPADAANK